jgi:tetratricopeptide (TPR) repeat protein/cellulose biosynthesis protein BcsQ
MGERTASTGSILTFYSYKGGTGRSMALANMAWVLASNGKRVLMVDWDLEAPGLHRYFHPFLQDRDLGSSGGVIDFVIDYAAEAMTPAAEQDPMWYLPHANILRYALSLHQFPGHGTLDFVPAGRQDALYSTRVNAFNWQNFYDRLGGGLFLEAVKDRMRREYDYVLIDSRTGVSDTSGVCTVQMPDTLVVCFTFNNQSIDGAAAVALAAAKQRAAADALPIKIFPVPTRVERAEKDRVELARLVARERFDELLEHLKPAARESYWGDVEIQYEPFYAFEEVLATLRDTPRLATSMLAAVERLTSYITEGSITEVVPLEEDLRLRLLADYARKPPARRASKAQFLAFYISYAHRDRDELMTRFLDDLRAEVSQLSGLSPQEIGFWDDTKEPIGNAWSEETRSALERCRFLLPLLSPAYFASEFCAKEFEAFRLRQEGGGGPLIFPISWISVPSYPAVVSAVQLQLLDLPDDYLREGLRFISRLTGRLTGRKDDYFRVVSQFAKVLVSHLHDDGPMAAPVPPFRELQNPFAAAVEASARIAPSRVHNLPYRSLGELFVGRERDLVALDAELAAAAPGGKAGRGVVLLGLAGVGKTRLAIEYAWRFGKRFSASFFVRMDGADLMHQLASRERGSILAWLQEQPNWLLILDGVDTDESAIEVRSLLARLPGGSVLITSRLGEWPRSISRFSVSPLSVSEAGQYLLMRADPRRLDSPSDPKSAARLAEALGGIPLALDLAAGCIREGQWTLDEYLAALRSEEKKLLAREWVGERTSPIAAASLQVFEQLTPGAASLLRLLAYLAPEPIPVAMLKAVEAALALNAETAAQAHALPAVEEAVAELARYSMVLLEDGEVAAHSLVQDLVRGQVPEEQRRGWIEHSLRLIEAMISAFSEDSAKTRLRPHVAAVVEHAEAASIADPTTRLMRWLAARNPEEAEQLLRRALNLAEQVNGPAHPDLTITLSSLGRVMSRKANYPEAESLLRRALALDEQVYKADGPEVVLGLNDLASLLRSSGRPAEAEPLARRALGITEGLLGSHPELRISSLRNMAKIELDLERVSEPETLLLQALELDTKVYGDTHPATAADLYTLGQMYQMRGRLDEAEPLLGRALAIDSEVYGADHPEVATDLRALAMLHLRRKQPEEAEPLLRRALSIHEASFGPDHPEAAMDLNSLAQILEVQRRFEEAESMYRRALAILERSLGSDHSATRLAKDRLREIEKVRKR